MESEKPDSEGYNKGKAGGSAQTKHDHLVAAREKRVTTKFPRIGKFLLAVSDEPQSTKAWAVGAIGEVAVGGNLDSLAEKYKFFVLHDRSIPKSRANIDHIAITQSGVIVIDAKNYRGTIEIKDNSGLFSKPDSQLWVGRRNCMKLVTGMKHQIEIVQQFLVKEKIEIPVIGVLAFYEATWGSYKFMRKQEVIDGVLINSIGIEPIVNQPGAVGTAQMEQVTMLLATHFKSTSET